jgi:hypothetical protein
MNNRFLAAFAIGIALIAIAVAGVLYMQRGARVGLTGKVLKVRTAPLDDNSSTVVVDFRFANPADVVFVVRTVTVLMEDNAGTEYLGQTIAEVDARRMFEGLPLLGQKYNDTLLMGDKIPSRSTQDRMVAARFEAPEARLEARKRFLVRIEDVDGPVTELSEK